MHASHLTACIANGNEGRTNSSNSDRPTDTYLKQFPILDNIIRIGFYVKTYLSRPVNSKL